MTSSTAIVRDLTLYSGWHREHGRRGKWRLLVQAGTHNECWQLLHDAKQGGDFLIAPPYAANPNSAKASR